MEAYLQTYLGISAVIWICAPAAMGEPAFVMTLPPIATFPCAIQDWMTFLLCSGYCSRHASSSRLFLTWAGRHRAFVQW